MDIHQLKTFVAVARERSITRASEILHLSQPAVSAHIKALEDTLGLALFERTPRGMSLTPEGQRLLAKAEQALAAHRELMDEATRIKGQVVGKLRLGAGSNSNHEAIGRLVTAFAERWPDVEVVLQHGTSRDVLAGIRNDTLDAGLYNEPDEPDPDIQAVEVSRFGIWVVAPPNAPPGAQHGSSADEPDWTALAELPWIYPTASACCAQTAERLFKAKRIRPKRIISVDREDVTRSLIAGGTGVGLLHAETAKEAESRGEVSLVFDTASSVRVLFACLRTRAQDPLLAAAFSILRADPNAI